MIGRFWGEAAEQWDYFNNTETSLQDIVIFSPVLLVLVTLNVLNPLHSLCRLRVTVESCREWELLCALQNVPSSSSLHGSACDSAGWEHVRAAFPSAELLGSWFLWDIRAPATAGRLRELADCGDWEPVAACGREK